MEADGAGGVLRGGFLGERRGREALDGGPPCGHDRGGARLELEDVYTTAGAAVVVVMELKRVHLPVQRAAHGGERRPAQHAAQPDVPEHQPRAFDPCVHGAVVAAPNPDERVGDLHGDDGPDDGSHERPLQQPLLVDEAAQEAHRGADHRPGCPADGGEEGASQPAGGSAGRREHLRRGLE